MTDKTEAPASVDRWTGAQLNTQSDDCRCVHAAEALASAAVALDPAVERLADVIAQRG